jgi:hypothetical protein
VYQAGHDLTVNMTGSVYRVESFPAMRRAGLTVEQARAQPSRLLAARFELVPFAGRAGLVRELSGWLGAGGPVSVRLVHGPGGQGKSRLAAQFVRCHAEGWVVWQGRQASSASPSRAPMEVPPGTTGLLVVVDYADRWAPSRLLTLITDMYASVRRLPETVPLRVLLLARTADFWWEALGQRLDADYEISATATVLPPLGEEVSRMELYTTAFDHFAAAMAVTSFDGQADDAERPPAGLGGRGFGQVLTVHMAALAAVDAYWRGEAAPTDPARISAYLLRRERGHWKEWNGRAEDRLPTGPEIMGHAVYAATLTGPLSHAEGVEVLARAKVASVAEKASQVLTDHCKCYPPENPATVLEPLYPDRLGEDFIALTTPRHEPGTAPTAAGSGDLAALVDSWADTAVGGLLPPPRGNSRRDGQSQLLPC